MNDNQPTRPLSHKEGRRVAKQFATKTARKWRASCGGWDSQDYKEAVQNLTEIYLQPLVNKGLVEAAA